MLADNNLLSADCANLKKKMWIWYFAQESNLAIYFNILLLFSGESERATHPRDLTMRYGAAFKM